MALKIMPHGRLQEWVADEKGYFTAEGLEYSFLTEGDYGIHAVRRDDGGEIKTGALGAEPQPLPRPAVRPGQLRRGRSGLNPAALSWRWCPCPATGAQWSGSAR
jgi:hypothetical protein